MNKIKILVIRLRRIGDAILSETVCKSLKKSIPNAEIHYVLYDFIGDLFSNDPNIDKIIKISQKERDSFFQYLKACYKIVTQNKYDIIIDLRSTANTFPFSLFSLRSKYRIAQKKTYNWIIYNHRINFWNEKNFIDQKLALLKPLEKEFDMVYDPNFNIYLTDEESLNFRQKMKDKGIDFDNPVVLCTVTTRVEKKCWPKDYMQNIINRVLKEYPTVQLVFNYSGKIEKENAYRMYKALNCHSNIFIDIEANSLRDLAAMTSNCNFFFGNEGGGRHLAEALNVPSLAYFSPGNSAKHWLTKQNSIYEGISCEDIKGIDFNKLTHEELLRLVTPDMMWNKLKPRLDKLVSKNKC